MTLNPDYVFCQGCGIEITWSPVLVNHHPYCCEECSRGIQCRCGDRLDIDDDRKSNSSVTQSPYG